MRGIKLHITNAGRYFTDNEKVIIRNAIHAAERFIGSHFKLDYAIDLVVTAPSFLLSTIPEDGISGRTYSSRLIILVLDKNQKEISQDIVFETICHEMSHSLRWEKLPEYSKTLYDAMILEGLAIALEEEAVRECKIEERQFFLREMQNTSQDAVDRMIAQLKGDMGSEQYDYHTIFYTGNDELPRWAGYRLGYYFVKRYLQGSGSTIFEATLASYSCFTLKS